MVLSSYLPNTTAVLLRLCLLWWTSSRHYRSLIDLRQLWLTRKVSREQTPLDRKIVISPKWCLGEVGLDPWETFENCTVAGNNNKGVQVSTPAQQQMDCERTMKDTVRTVNRDSDYQEKGQSRFYKYGPINWNAELRLYTSACLQHERAKKIEAVLVLLKQKIMKPIGFFHKNILVAKNMCFLES